MTKKRKKGVITPMSQPVAEPYMMPGQQASENLPNADIPPPPAPDTNSPIFITKNPSFIEGIFKSLCFCVPTAIVLIAVALWYFQNITVRFIPEFKTVLQTLQLVRPNADFKAIPNTPNSPIIATVTQVILNNASGNNASDNNTSGNADKTATIFGVIYNTTPNTISQATLVLGFMTHNNTLISTQTHTIKTIFNPNKHTEFSLNLPHIPLYADTIKIQSAE